MRLSQPVAEYLAKFTTNKALVDVIAQHFFQDTPTFFALSYFSLYLDYCYPKGGTGMVLISYFAVRDAAGTYLGVLEVTQNIGPIQRLEGEKRLVTDES